MGELELIEALRTRLARDDARVRIGIGDDCALLAPLARGVVLSVDVAVEGVHFDPSWLSWPQIGRRAFVAAISDLAAMGAEPVAALLSLVLPARMSEAEALALIDGVADAADAHRTTVVGGNLSAGAELVISTTVIGEDREPTLRREGARPGDAVFVTGVVGAAALGWRLLAAGQGDDEEARSFVRRWRSPRARFDVVDRVRAVATACIDVSDGLVQDLGHVATASGVGARIELERLPLEPGFGAMAARLGEDADALALAGGEDYELLFTAPAQSEVEGWATRVGRVVEGAGVRVLRADGSELALASTGHRHF